MDNPQLIYLSNERFPATLACTIQQMLMCEAFAKAGADVTLWVPHYLDTPKLSAEELYEYYGVEPNFFIQRLPSLLHLSKPLVNGKRRIKIPLIGGLSVLLSTRMLANKLLRQGELNSQTIIYSRNVNSAYTFYKLNQRHTNRQPFSIFFEVHSLDEQRPTSYFHTLLRKSDGLVCISDALKQAIIETFDVDAQKICVAHDGVRQYVLERGSLNKETARAQLGLTAHPIVLYTGQLLPGKGADVFVEAAKQLPEVHFLLVGGHGHYLERMRARLSSEQIINVELVGFVPPHRVPLYQSAADVLVLPATADHKISTYTSPLKLFEYMAAQRPLVASDLPVLQEILADDDNALLFRERDAQDLAMTIQRVLSDRSLAERMAQRAFDQVQEYTWEQRAQQILNFINETRMP